MAMPGLASLDALAQAGVRRISAGPAFFRHAYGTAEASVKAWLEGDFAPSFANGLDYARMNALFPYVGATPTPARAQQHVHISVTSRFEDPPFQERVWVGMGVPNAAATQKPTGERAEELRVGKEWVN